MNLNKSTRNFFIVFVSIIQVIFLLAIFKENAGSLGVVALMIILCILVLVTTLRGQIHHKDHAYEHILVVLWIPAAALASFYLNHFLKLGPVISAASVGSLGSFIPNIRKHSHYLQQLPAAIYCGAFIGMSSEHVASGLLFIITASFFTAILLFLSKNLFAGVGGKLGTLAFAGVAITSFLYFLISSYV
ncbi:hypothetical protein [Pedobacter hartonius]|uniref:Uncharacterized protein n=1 Tax=Pedobacter hartonius TaxID=425514 RepID=A0A1H3WQS6_9SPHI|nr:hypothetical protein [Pedobacter hartonius]SDZ88538.1 hypothetical protein SAMN05443550_101325 [Pedobacter hartonius]